MGCQFRKSYLVKNNVPYAWCLGGTEKKRSTSLSRMSSKPQSSPELEKVKKEEKPGGSLIKLIFFKKAFKVWIGLISLVS